MPYRINITELWNNLRIKQAATLYLASFAGIPLSIFTSIVFTRFLGPQGYGDFSFIDSLFDVAIIIFPAGLFFAGNRALLLNKEPAKAREYYGATLVYLFLVFLLMTLFLVGYAFLDPNLKAKGLDRFFLMLLPAGWIFLLRPYFDNMLHADNRIHDLAATRFLPKVFTFIAALMIYYFATEFTGNRLSVMWAIYLFAFLMVYLFVFSRIRLSFRYLGRRMREVRTHHRNYGIHLYVGNLFSAGAVSLTGILISYFSADNTGVGFLALAVAIARPMALIPGVVATTWFKDFAGRSSIPGRLTSITLLMSLGGFVVLYLLAGPFVRFFYTDAFLPVIHLARLAGIGMGLYGLGDFHSRFLEAHGQGKSVRNIHIIMGLTLLFGNLLLIPPFDVTGAAIAMILAASVYAGGMWYHYVKVEIKVEIKVEG